jgi:hypothetical protein
MILYHGSGYRHTELKPGFHHTGVEVNWDEVESNHYLYASTVREDAIDQGFASQMEQKFAIRRYRSTGRSGQGKIQIELDPAFPVTDEEIEKIKVYVYRIKKLPQDGWVKNNNPHNNLSTEWKTDHVIKDAIERTIEIPIGRILVDLIVYHRKDAIVFEGLNFKSMGLEAIDKPAYSTW